MRPVTNSMTAADSIDVMDHRARNRNFGRCVRALPWISGLAALIVATDQEDGIDGLNSGIDLLLVSYDTEQYFTVFDCLFRATHRNEIDHGRLEASRHRLSRLTATLRSAL